MTLFASILLGAYGMARGVDHQLVTCQQPVDVRFIASAGQERPEFSEEVAPGQKHWWSFGCKLNDNFIAAEERKLQDAGKTKTTTDSKKDDKGKTPASKSKPCTANCTVTAAPKAKASANKTSKGNQTATTEKDVKKTTASPIDAEASGCVSTAWNTLAASLSLSLPFVMAHDAQAKEKDHIDVLLPCSALIYPLNDLDGDGELDCKMTKEQSAIATVVPALEGNWKVSAARSVAHGRSLVTPKLQGEKVTFGDGAMCVDIPEGASWTYFHQNEKIELFQSLLPTAIAKVAGFTHKGHRCEAENCEASMWSFDMIYPTSACTPDLAGWVRPASAKLMPNGQLILIRGESATAGSVAQRPPLMEDIESIHDVLPFANGLSAAVHSQFDVLILQKAGHGRHKAFVEGDVDANGVLSFSEFEAVMNKLPGDCADAF